MNPQYLEELLIDFRFVLRLSLENNYQRQSEAWLDFPRSCLRSHGVVELGRLMTVDTMAVEGRNNERMQG